MVLETEPQLNVLKVYYCLLNGNITEVIRDLCKNRDVHT